MLDRLRNMVDGARLLAGGKDRRGGGIVLGYHDLVSGQPRTQYDVAADRFAAHIQALRGWGLQLVPLSALVHRLVSDGDVDGLVAVTFDDALEGVYQHAWPILAEMEVPFTVFAVSAELGTDPPWWPGSGRIMTREHLRELAEAGVEIECHSRHHPSLPALPRARLRDEIFGAKAELEDLAGRSPRLMAYPFGHHDAAVRGATAEAGYDAGFSFLNGRVTAQQDRFRLPRFTMTQAHHRARLALHVARASDSWPDTQADVVDGEWAPSGGPQ